MFNDFFKYLLVVVCIFYIGLWLLEIFKDKCGFLFLGRFVKVDKIIVYNKIFN